MARLLNVVLILSLLFLAVDVDARLRRHKKRLRLGHKRRHHLVPKLPFYPIPKYEEEPGNGDNELIPPGNGDNELFPPGNGDNELVPPGKGDNEVVPPGAVEEIRKDDFIINNIGHWEVISENAGVSAMQINLLPTNKIIVFDATAYHTSRIKLPEGTPCLPFKDFVTKEDRIDCFAHSVEYDIETNQVRPLTVRGDPWCSSGGLAPDGTLVGSGGFMDGGRTLRYIGGPGGCQDCDWREYSNVLAQERWYATQQILPNGDFIVIGGRRSFSYEFIPRQEGQSSTKSFFFPFLYETSDLDENNLYPFVHLSTDGNLFIFSNNRSLLLNPTSHKVVRTFPVLPGGSRNYPASGMSALLPIDLNVDGDYKAEVIVCGGNLPIAYELSELRKIFLPALQDCNRLTITEPYSEWDSELMPSRRTLGDALILPNGEILLINGAQVGTAAWRDADLPNYTPALYSPDKPKGLRFRELNPTQIARMYHSASLVLPDGRVWVGGSNTHETYRDNDRFPTETRVEAFSPPYLDVDFDIERPMINEDASAKELQYGEFFETQFTVQGHREFWGSQPAALTVNDIKVTMYFPPFTTHGFSMGQRLLVLKLDSLTVESPGLYRVRMAAPPNSAIAPPGYYLLFVNHRGVPGKGMWVHIQ